MPVFSDAVLIDIVEKAARKINRKLCLFGTDREITINPSTGELLTPDPTSSEGKRLYDLVLMQAECLITIREYQSELRSGDGGVLVNDGEQTVDTRGVGVARGTFFCCEYSPCAELKDEIKIEKMRDTGDAGHLIW